MIFIIETKEVVIFDQFFLIREERKCLKNMQHCTGNVSHELIVLLNLHSYAILFIS